LFCGRKNMDFNRNGHNHRVQYRRTLCSNM
jgi:hypothetical protein